MNYENFVEVKYQQYIKNLQEIKHNMFVVIELNENILGKEETEKNIQRLENANCVTENACEILQKMTVKFYKENSLSTEYNMFSLLFKTKDLIRALEKELI